MPFVRLRFRVAVSLWFLFFHDIFFLMLRRLYFYLIFFFLKFLPVIDFTAATRSEPIYFICFFFSDSQSIDKFATEEMRASAYLQNCHGVITTTERKRRNIYFTMKTKWLTVAYLFDIVSLPIKATTTDVASFITFINTIEMKNGKWNSLWFIICDESVCYAVFVACKIWLRVDNLSMRFLFVDTFDTVNMTNTF